MSEFNLEAIRNRAIEAQRWCTASPEPPHEPLDFVPLETREHFERDMPALLALVEDLRFEIDILRAAADVGIHLKGDAS